MNRSKRLLELANRAIAIIFGFSVLCGLSMGAAMAARAQTTADPAGATGVTEGDARLDYSVGIEGVPEKDLHDALMQVLQLEALRRQPPLTLAGLRRRADGDVDRMLAVLRSEGFYGASIDVHIDTSESPVAVVLALDTGAVYLLAEYDIRYGEDTRPQAGLVTNLGELGLHIGMPARAAPIAEAQQVLLRRLAENGWPLSEVRNREVVVDHANTTMSVSLEVDPGPRATFGPVSFAGQVSVEEDYLRRFVPWSPGQLYEQNLVEELRRSLTDTGLFQSVTVELAPRVDARGRLPMTVHVSERRHRSISIGVGFESDTGFRADASWQHRNLMGRQETLTVGIVAAEIEQGASAEFRKPNVGRFGQDLLTNVAVRHLESDAFDEESVTAFLGLERELGPLWTVRGGVSFEFASIDDQEEEEEFRLFGLPITAVRDSSDDLLDPTTGSRLHLEATPYVDPFDADTEFLSLEASFSKYLSLLPDDRLILAGRAKLGSILGENTEAVPASKRFYAGGGGSIRGYEFQTVGPLDDEDDPVGGRSVVELGLETRIRLTDLVGLVPFIEGGNVYDDSLPDFSEELRWAAGIGARVFTVAGPIRVDFAFPINGRDGVDDTFEFYVSVGQAF